MLGSLRASIFGWCGVACLTGLVALSPATADQARYGESEVQCVASKQSAAARYCESAFRAWSRWERRPDDARRDRDLARARSKLARSFDKAEQKSAENGVDCVDQTVGAAELAGSMDAGVSSVVAALQAGLDDADSDSDCGRKFVDAASRLCGDLLENESWRTAGIDAQDRRLHGKSSHKKSSHKKASHKKSSHNKSSGKKASHKGRHHHHNPLDVQQHYEEHSQWASDRFDRDWERGRCSTDASQSDIASQLADLARGVVFDTVVAPGLDASEFQPISPVGPIDYEGATLNPRCGFDANPDYHFFVKRGTVNKLVVYYQGGGACWENLTCNIPVCKNRVDLSFDDPDNATAGFADLSNPDNPFKDWNAVFVPYCTCDVHFGDVDQIYVGVLPDVRVSHRGYQNAKTVEKFARENFLKPEAVFVTGSSAGGYGALFHGPFLRRVWPRSRFSILGDASNGVITLDFLQNEFENWNFLANIPDDIPGAVESISGGDGMVGYLEAVANYFPDTKWANYTTGYDGGTGGQTGFYNVMLQNSPLGALSWWNASCEFHDVMVEQAADTAARVPSNYRYYIGAGSAHTMYGSDKVYSDQSGGESQTILDWVNDMLAFDPAAADPGAPSWQSVECDDCEIVLPGDPLPGSLPTAPFALDIAGNPVIRCPPFPRGPDPTPAALEADLGPFPVRSYRPFFTPGFGAGTIWYPANPNPGPFAVIAVSPGFTAPESTMAWVGPRLASNGFIVITISTQSPFDNPTSRAKQLMAALRLVAAEGRRPSPIIGRVDGDRTGLIGHSMGGGGSLIAARDNPSVDAIIPLAPWNSPAKDFSAVEAASLIVACERDEIARVSQHAKPFYDSIPAADVNKAFLEFRGADHLCVMAANDHYATLGKYIVAWMKAFLDSDTRYDEYLCGAPHDDDLLGTEISRYLENCPY